MNRIVSIEAFGFEPVPWSVPDIGTTTTQSGKRVRFARRGKKTDIDHGRLSLESWQVFVRNAAEAAMATVAMPTGPIQLHMEFYAKTPKGRRDYELWDAPVRWNESKSTFSKTQPRGKPEADLVNLFKGTEDALAGVVFPNDCQTRMLTAYALYGPIPGVRIWVYVIEPSDYPGQGKPIE